MKEIRFRCHGHPNIRGTHKKTFEFTKDKDLTPNGDCIIGVGADFELDKLKEMLGYESAEIEVSCNGLAEKAKGQINPNFNHSEEIVARKSNFDSDRTLILFCDKGADDFSRDLIQAMKTKESVIEVRIMPFN